MLSSFHKALLRQLMTVWLWHYLVTASLLINSIQCFPEPQPLRQAMATPGFFSRTLEIPPLSPSDGKYGSSIPVCYTNSPDTLALWLQDRLPTVGATIGVDVESVPNVPWLKTKFQGPATVQLAVPHAAIVVHLVDAHGNPSDASASVLQSLLADTSIVKAGVGIDQDMLELYRTWGCSGDIVNRFDMGGIGATNGASISLKALTKAVIDIELLKSRKLAMSNWGLLPLKETQIAYCARDAWAAAAVTTELAERDPFTFSTTALIQLLESEFCISELDERAKRRKEAKVRLIEIVGKGADRVPRKDLTDELRRDVDELDVVLRALAPQSLLRYDINALG